MRKFLLVLGIMALICSPAMAGKNAGGAMVVHTDDSIVYTSFDSDYCDNFYAVDPGDDCGALNTMSSVDGNIDGAIIFLLAAFAPGSSPGVTVCYFGIDHNFAVGWIVANSFCGPAGSLEIPDTGWPNNPATAGNSVAFGTPVTGDLVFPFYWLAAYGLAGNYLGTAINPTGGYAGFVSDDNPGVLDECHLFGTARWFEGGFNDCPNPPQDQACCFADGSCIMALPGDCEALGGIPWGVDTVCEPNPCPPPVGACCYEDGSCVMTDEASCFASGGTLWYGDRECQPNPCPQPPQACCFEDGHCEMQLVEDCTALGGTPWGDGTTCDPNPCPPPPPMGACCYDDGSCVETLEADCDGYDWYVDTPCDPNPCEPIATEDATWGSIKSSYK